MPEQNFCQEPERYDGRQNRQNHETGGDGKITPLPKKNPACYQAHNLQGRDTQHGNAPSDAGGKRPGVAKKQSGESDESKGWNGNCDKYGCDISKFLQEVDHFSEVNLALHAIDVKSMAIQKRSRSTRIFHSPRKARPGKRAGLQPRVAYFAKINDFVK